MTLHNPAFTPYSTQLAAIYGAPITLVDDAFEWALDTARLQDGWSGIPDLNPLIYNRIASDVEAYIAHEMETAA